jgi:hypothetical protein
MTEQRVLEDSSAGRENSSGSVIRECPDTNLMEQNRINIGKDAVTVYIIKYMLACMRSG